MMNFAAIDFETATSRMNSACSVAVIEVKDNKIVDTYYTLIRPPRLCFSSFNIHIHGITPQMVVDEPEFADIWPELWSHLAGRIVVAHNAQFDMGVLKSELLTNGLELPAFYHCCTVSLSRKAWPSLVNHKLDTVGDYLHIEFQHHNALDDARTCAAIPLAAGRELCIDDLNELAAKLQVAVKPFK